MEYISALSNTEILPRAKIRMGLEGIILNDMIHMEKKILKLSYRVESYSNYTYRWKSTIAVDSS
jgi:hypothetical protein